MKHIIKFRWVIAAFWVIITASLFIFAPNLQDLVAEKGQITVPYGYSSQEAQELLDNMSTDDSKSDTSAVLVFHDDKGLSKADKDAVSQAIDQLEDNKKQLGLSDILAFTDASEIEEQTVSEDGTTILVPFDVSLENQEIDASRDKIYKTVENIKVDHYITGEDYIQQDILQNSEDGLQKTELITVGLILVILFIVFKSFVAPLIPLLTVGISYLAAQGIVSILADTVNFPLSTFTQIFMVAVMFGIGADYCILLISRFKEEIARHDTIQEAVITTYKSGGKTVLFAGLAVLIGFSTIGLSTFSLYQSAVAVAVGVAVVLIALTTLVPFFMVVLGRKLFWPFDKNVAHKESGIWKAAGTFAWGRPVIALLIVAVITVSALLSYNGDTSYDSLAEIGDDYDSVIAFNWIADSFGPGQTMPTTVVMETDKKVDSPEAYQAIESISQEIAKMDGVEQVRSATRPAGDVIEDFLVENQTEKLADGIDDSTKGLSQIQDGLQEAADEFKSAPTELADAQDGVSALMDGTQSANNGIEEMNEALKEIQNGIQSGSQGAHEIKSNLQTIKDNLDDSISGNKELLAGYEAFTEGVSGVGGQLDDEDNKQELEQLKQQIKEMQGALSGAKNNVDNMFDTALEANPELEADPDFQEAYGTAKGQIDGVMDGVNEAENQLAELENLAKSAPELLDEQVLSPLHELNDGLRSSIEGQEQLSSGIGELISGVTELQSGLDQAADGQSEVVNNIPSLQDGLSEIYGGQKELKTAFADMQDQLGELSDGLNDSTDGLQDINDGLTEVERYLGDYKLDSNDPIVVIPEEALDNEDFMDGTKPYLSDDKTITKFDVVLTHNPYSTEAIQMIDDIEDQVNDAKKDTLFENSDPKLGGISSTNNDLQNISDADYSRTVLLMVAGIFIILVILLRSLVMPLYLIGSLILTYFTSMAVAEIVFVNILGYDGLTWAIPFFSFVMLMALGIDYSIFLMDRFNEDRDGNVKDALLSAMKNMGTVIISAAVILGGTFGAMLPSGVLSLLQIATVVLTGLFLYAFVMLPLFVPVMVRLFGKANWWPFKHDKKEK